MKVIPYILAFLSIGLVATVIISDRVYSAFDPPKPTEEIVRLSVNTIPFKKARNGMFSLPITALTKDRDENWVVYVLEEHSARNHQVSSVRVDVEKLEKDRALIKGSKGITKDQMVMGDGLHLVVPGQIVLGALASK